MTFTSNKVFNLGSAAFRQWRATHSHCQYIHGYNLTANITFECEKLDDKNWCADFGCFKGLKTIFKNTFDHKLVVAGDDPELESFQKLDEKGVVQLVVLQSGVGCERFAEHVLKTADKFIERVTDGRVRVKSVQINEHDDNFATCYRQDVKVDSFSANVFEPSDAIDVLEDVHGAVAVINVECTSDVSSVVDEQPTTESSDSPTSTANPKAAAVGKVNGTKTKGGWFDGTTWG